MRETTYIKAISEALREELARDESVVRVGLSGRARTSAKFPFSVLNGMETTR